MGAGRGEALVLHCHWLTAGDQHQDKPIFVDHRQGDSPPMMHTCLLRGSVSLNSDCLCVSEVVVPVASCFSSISISMEVRSYHRTHDSDCSFANACSSPPSLTSASAMDHRYPLHAISQQPRNRSTSESDWSMQARWSQTSISWYVYRTPTSRAAQLWAKAMRPQSQPLLILVRVSTLPPRRGGGLVQWLIRCTESSWCCACCCPAAY